MEEIYFVVTEIFEFKYREDITNNITIWKFCQVLKSLNQVLDEHFFQTTSPLQM